MEWLGVGSHMYSFMRTVNTADISDQTAQSFWCVVQLSLRFCCVFRAGLYGLCVQRVSFHCRWLHVAACNASVASAAMVFPLAILVMSAFSSSSSACRSRWPSLEKVWYSSVLRSRKGHGMPVSTPESNHPLLFATSCSP